MNKVLVMLFGIGMVVGILGITIILRPGYMVFRERFNSTVYSLNTSQGITEWGKVRGTLDYVFVVVPIICILVVVAFVYMSMQEKEYYEVGYYR